MSFLFRCAVSMVVQGENRRSQTARRTSPTRLIIYSLSLTIKLNRSVSLNFLKQTRLMFLVAYQTITTQVIIYRLVLSLK